jgi:hypothetical protein
MHLLVELYQQLEDAEYTSFSTKPFVDDITSLSNALADVSRDGFNTWFYDNGTFTWNDNENDWDWSVKKTIG